MRRPAPSLAALLAPILLAPVLVVLAAGSTRAQEVVRVEGRAARSASIDFWRAFGDPTLERLIGEALDTNLDIRAAGARIESARAERLGAVLDLAPTVTAVGAYSRQRYARAAIPGTVPGTGGMPDQGLWEAGVRLSWDIDVFGRGRRTLRARNALLDAAEIGVEDARVLIAAEVAAAYFDLRGAHDRLDVARRNAENQRRTLQVTLDRLEGGRGTALDTERARAQLNSTLAAVPQLELAVATARNRIDVLLGRPSGSAGAGLEPDTAAFVLPEILEPSGTEALIRSRPDVRSAERRLAASSAFVDAARAEYMPRLSISGTAGYTAGAFDALGDGGTPRYAIGPVVSWPLFDLGRVKAGVDAARAAEAEAEARYRLAILRAREELETALVAYRTSRERLRHLAEAAAASERATELARLRFEEGASDFLQVLDAERTQLAAQDLLARGRADATAALVAVYRALGGRRPVR